MGGPGPFDNRPVIASLVSKRRELAELLGYDDFADLQTASRMVRSGARAAAFVADLTRRTEPTAASEAAELLAYAREQLGLGDLQPWDERFATEKYRASLDLVDDEELRPYFALPNVLTGLFELTKTLFGVSVRRTAGVPTWHEDVETFELTDEDGTVLGSLYADWYPRETKRAGGWMNGLLTGGPTPEGFVPHVGTIATNFTPPGDGPALLTHREVQTVFHEFGHLLHHVMARVPVRALSGTSVAWDFVELPSQIMENWTWEADGLALFARHVETGEPLPAALFERLRAGRTVGAGLAQMRQLMLGTVDLAVHRQYDPAATPDVVAYADEVMAPFALRPEYRLGSYLTRLSHIFSGGYAAGYYSYKWSEVLDADAFERFREHGIFDQATGRLFADVVLRAGNSVDPAELFRRFVGRDPDPSALLRRNLGVDG